VEGVEEVEQLLRSCVDSEGGGPGCRARGSELVAAREYLRQDSWVSFSMSCTKVNWTTGGDRGFWVVEVDIVRRSVALLWLRCAALVGGLAQEMPGNAPHQPSPKTLPIRPC